MNIADQALAAQDVAQAAILEFATPHQVGAFLEAELTETQDPQCAVALHTFVCSSSAYPGWYWSVAVVAVEGQEHCTVSDVNLLPGPDALVPPAWTPWAERVQPGDLGVGDLLPTPADDVRLTAGFTGLDDLSDELEPLHPAQWELGLGREQVLSAVGIEQAVSRWFAGDTGPKAAMAKAAPAQCGTCGFFTAIGGSIGQVFGICANEFGAADGRIVATTFGCGAHSSVRPQEKAPVPTVGLVVDDQADELSDASDLIDLDIPGLEAETMEPATVAVSEIQDLSVDNPDSEISGVDESEAQLEPESDVEAVDFVEPELESAAAQDPVDE